MTRTLLILQMFTLSYFNCPAQTQELKFDRMRIAHSGDSLLKQEYELIVKSKKVYFITFSASYLHIKGGKYGTRVKFDRINREKIFHLANQLNWTNCEQLHDKEIKGNYFVIQSFQSDNLINDFKVAHELLPLDFQELFDMLSKK
jgi:hypothetical protein